MNSIQAGSAGADDIQASVANIRNDLKSSRAALRLEFAQHRDPSRLLRQHRQLVDRTLKQMWVESGVPKSFALLAVGGYGRGDLFPGSDVDLLFLLPDDLDHGHSASLEVLIGRLWDTGLEVGHSVRTLAQCDEEASKDLTVQTTFLEARLIAGNRTLFRRFIGHTQSHFDPQTFFNAKRLEQEQRHAKYQDTPYSLEPNIKEAPGGMRDLQTILWIARASGLANSWTELARRGFVTTAEARHLARCERLLRELRIRLHYAAERREDRLLFDYQDRIARDFGYRSAPQRRASEFLMQRYFRNAKAVTQLNTILLQNIGAAIFADQEGEAKIINERFQAVHQLLDAREPDLFERNPRAIFESFQILQATPELKGMTAQTLRALWRARFFVDGAFRRDPHNRAAFLSILQQQRGIVHELRRMNQYGLLGRYLPAFRRIVGQMQHDLFHVYTVDQHTLAVVRNIRRFTMVEFAHEYPLCSRLIAGLERHWLLYVAAIFHDIAKGRGGDHSTLGVADASRFCRAHGISGEDRNLVEFLVQHHLTMSTVAQKQDLSDPEVVRRFADVVGSERHLVALYLLTVADIRGTSPKVWNAWRGKLLEDLFHLTRRLLLGEDIGYDRDIAGKQDEAKRLLRLYALSDTVQDALWKELDLAYFLRHDAQEIAWQTRLLNYRVNSEKPVVKARLSPAGEGLQVMIYTRDQRYLFARICGFLSALGFNIVDAKIHTTRHGYALDTFQVMGTGSMPHYRDIINLIEHDLAERLTEQSELPTIPQTRLSRQLRHFPITPEVHIIPDEQGRFYALSVIAGDRPGLLYDITRLLAQYEISVHTAKIITLGERVEDVFRISGQALSNARAVLLLEQDLLQALQP